MYVSVCIYIYISIHMFERAPCLTNTPSPTNKIQAEHHGLIQLDDGNLLLWAVSPKAESKTYLNSHKKGFFAKRSSNHHLQYAFLPVKFKEFEDTGSELDGFKDTSSHLGSRKQMHLPCFEFIPRATMATILPDPYSMHASISTCIYHSTISSRNHS